MNGIRSFILGILLILGSSAHAEPSSGRDIPGTAATIPPASNALSAPAAVAPSGNYILSPNDVLAIRVFQEEDLSGQHRIGQDGMITYPLVGTVRLGGKTVSEATRALAGALRTYLKNPQVSIDVSEYSKRRFVVLGQVQRPGTYLIPSEEKLDLLSAIAAAGGYTRLADPGNIIVRSQAGGGEVVKKVNAKAMARQKEPLLEIQPDDKITVGERLF